MRNLVYKPFEGLQIICTKCRRTIHNGFKPTKKCKHPINFQKYKAVYVVPNSGKKRKAKNLESSDYNQAVMECINFKNQIYGITPEEIINPQLFNDCIAMYSDYMENEGIPSHKQKPRTTAYVKTTIKYLEQFRDFLQSEGYSMNRFTIDDLTDKEVGKYHSYLIALDQSNYTYNAKIKALRSLNSFLIQKHQYKVNNPWLEVKLKPETSTNTSISLEDFNDVIDIITPANSINKIGKTVRNMYKDWLIDIFKLKAFTGRRHEELAIMRWNMINYKNGKPVYLQSPNLKTIRQKNIAKEKDWEYTFVPIGKELMALLNQLGLENNKDSTNYIIAPNETSRIQIQNLMGKCFTFFWSKLERDYLVNLKHLRQTYITAESFFLSRITLQHSDFRTTEKHYIDKRAVAIKMAENGFRVFPENE